MASPVVRRPHIDDGLTRAGESVKTIAHPKVPGVDLFIGEGREEVSILLTLDEAVLIAGWLLQRAEECRR